MKINNFYILVFLASLFSIKIQAQDDANCGIIIDGVKAEKIDCWSFGEMDLVFPINDKYKKYERIDVYLYFVESDNERVCKTLCKTFSPESFSDNFSTGKYGVWRVLRDKKKDAIRSLESFYFDRKLLNKYTPTNRCAVYVKGYVVTGYSYDSYGTRVPTYGNGAILYKSEFIPVESTIPKYNENFECKTKGQPWNLTIEKSPAYQDDLGIIK